MEKTINYSSKVVAYIDILGFGEIVKALTEKPKLHERLSYALQRIKYIEKSVHHKKSVTSDLEASAFSDSIVISTEENNIFSLIWTSGWLQAELLYTGILTRGGISLGLLHHKDGIIYGEGLISAYNLEQKSAIYPRIVISKKLIDNHNEILSNWIVQDFDGFYFLDPFKFDAVAGDAAELAADGYDPREIYFKEVRAYLLELRKNSSEENHLAKHTWMIKRFNVALTEFNKSTIEKVELIN